MAYRTKYGKHIRDISIGYSIYESISLTYDFIFYPFALAYWGLITGGIIAAGGSLIQCVIMFWLYDKMRVDWVGAHALKELEQKLDKTWFERMITWLSKEKKSRKDRWLSPVVFIALTLPLDPLVVALHYRRKHFEGITSRDWGLLLSAVIAGNAWWLLKIGVLVETFKYIWYLFF